MILTGCARWIIPADVKGPFTSLPEFEGRIESPTERITLGGSAEVSIGIVVTSPVQLADKTVVIRFANDRDADYRILDRSRGSLVAVKADDGRVAAPDTEFRYVSSRRPNFTLLESRTRR
jgi:hypothetical protein